MPGLKHTLAAIPVGGTRRYYGTAHWDGTQWYAMVGGNPLSAYWQDPLQPVQGGGIVVDLTNQGRGQYSAYVLGSYTLQPRPSTGTVQSVIPAGVSTKIVFTGADGVSYTTDQFIGSYNPGDPVFLTWDAGKPTILGKINAMGTTPPPDSTDEAVTTVKRTIHRPATKSNTWWAPGGWGSYATSRFGGEDVYSGTWGGATVTGAWWYGPKPDLGGKTVTKVTFRLPQRLGAGNNNAPATIHLYGHPATAQGGTDVSRTVGPVDVVVSPGAGPKTITLPSTFHSIAANGGGISIAGEPYVGFRGRRADPQSGKLTIETE